MDRTIRDRFRKENETLKRSLYQVETERDRLLCENSDLRERIEHMKSLLPGLDLEKMLQNEIPVRSASQSRSPETPLTSTAGSLEKPGGGPPSWPESPPVDRAISLNDYSRRGEALGSQAQVSYSLPDPASSTGKRQSSASQFSIPPAKREIINLISDSESDSSSDKRLASSQPERAPRRALKRRAVKSVRSSDEESPHARSATWHAAKKRVGAKRARHLTNGSNTPRADSPDDEGLPPGDHKLITKADPNLTIEVTVDEHKAIKLSGEMIERFMTGPASVHIENRFEDNFSRRFLTDVYGASPHTFLWQSKPGENFLQFIFPTPELNPYAPRTPGDAGLLLSCRTDMTIGRWTLFIRKTVSPSRWIYGGEYESEVVGHLDGATFSEQKVEVKEGWAKKVIKNKRWPAYLDMKACIELRKEGIPINGPQVIGNRIQEIKRRDHEVLTLADVIRAFENEEEVIKVIHMKCVGYDDTLVNTIERRLRSWVEKPLRRRKKKASNPQGGSDHAKIHRPDPPATPPEPAYLPSDVSSPLSSPPGSDLEF